MNKKLIAGVAFGAVAAAALGGAAGRWPHAVAAEPVNSPAAPAATGGPSSFADIVQRVAPAVVSIDVEGKLGAEPAAMRGGSDDDQEDASPFGPGQRGHGRQGGRNPHPGGIPKEATGSGFIISADGYIVTNNHVVEGADKITVRTNDDRSLTAKLVGRDPATDLAVIKVEEHNLPFVSFEDRAKPRVGDWVIAVGNPFNFGGTATAGIVSALARPDVSGTSYVDYMQIDAPINQGNSGGPSFDVYGRVVGVNSAILSPGGGGSVGIGFDIPADVAASVTRQLISNGKVTRGYIGATVQSVTPEIAESMGLTDHKGALIAEMTPGGPAAKAGLQAGDLVVRIGGKDVASAADLTRQVALAKEGDEIRLQIRRDSRMQDIVVRSGLRPSEEEVAKHG